VSSRTCAVKDVSRLKTWRRRCAKFAWRCSRPTSTSKSSNSSSKASKPAPSARKSSVPSPLSQQIIGIINEELIKILGSHEAKLRFANDPPSVFLIVGLQGSGKTTSTGKLARWLTKNGHRPEVVSVDIYRPAARKQLEIIARDNKIPVYPGPPRKNSPSISPVPRAETPQ